MTQDEIKDQTIERLRWLTDEYLKTCAELDELDDRASQVKQRMIELENVKEAQAILLKHHGIDPDSPNVGDLTEARSTREAVYSVFLNHPGEPLTVSHIRSELLDRGFPFGDNTVKNIYNALGDRERYLRLDRATYSLIVR